MVVVMRHDLDRKFPDLCKSNEQKSEPKPVTPERLGEFEHDQNSYRSA